MRLLTPFAVATTALSLANAELKASAQRWIVIGTNGELLDVDPTPYMPANRLERKRRDEEARKAAQAMKQLESAVHSSPASALRPNTDLPQVEKFFDDDEDAVLEGETSDADEQLVFSDTHIPDIETLAIESDAAADHDAWLQELEASTADASSSFMLLLVTNATSSGSASVWGDWARMLEDDSAFPTVQSSVVFAELSCLFVMFIGYLVLSIPLWPVFSRGQKCCLLLAFAAAFVYQIVALCWYFGGISPDITLSISSLITRTISLGMVPITTTSFMGRARLAVEEKNNHPKELPAETAPVYPPSRHRRAKAKAAAAAAAAAAALASEPVAEKAAIDNLSAEAKTVTDPQLYVARRAETVMPSSAVCRIAVFLASAVFAAALSAAAAGTSNPTHQCPVPDDQLPVHAWRASPHHPHSRPNDLSTADETPFNFSALFQSLVTIFLLCGEFVILGAALFGGMVHFTPGVGLQASKTSSLASLMAILSAIGYHAVALGWYLGHLGVLHVVCFAPVFQALLTVAVAFLYAAAMDLYNHADDNRSTHSIHAFSPSDSISQRHSHRRARWY